MERYVRINSLTLKVENALEAEEASIKNSPDYDLWICDFTPMPSPFWSFGWYGNYNGILS